MPHNMLILMIRKALQNISDRFIFGTTGAVELYNDGKDVYGDDVEIPTEGIKFITDWLIGWMIPTII